MKKPAKPGAGRADALRELGYRAFRDGKPERAQALFERALALHGNHPTILSDLGVVASALGRFAVARDYHARALDLRRGLLGPEHPEVAASLHNLGVVCRNLGEFAQAAACHGEAVAIWRRALGPAHPAVARGLSSQGMAASAAGDTAGALHYHREALRIREAARPAVVADVVASLEVIGALLESAGDHDGACRHWQRALDMGATGKVRATLLTRIGVVRRNLRDLEGADAHFNAALQADPDLPAARHQLALLLARSGRHEAAAYHRDRALRQQCVFIQEAPAPCCRVLILAGSDVGNVPLEHLLPEATVTRIWWFVAHADARQFTTLPAYDLVFNGIGDPDMAGPADAAAAAFLRGCDKPVLNHPVKVQRTRRDRLPALLAGIPGLVIPPVIRFDPAAGSGTLREMLAEAGISPPLLLRPPGSHGGAGVLRIDSWADLDAHPVQGSGCYATAYVDCAAADGFFRKYRVAFVDREPLPYHLAISPHWMVHYFSSDMQAHAWKLAEEAAFLSDWRAAIGDTAADAIVAIGRRLDLEFCGIDFAVDRAGRLVVFEANATMLVHPEAAEGLLAFKNASVRRIVDAVQAMLIR